MANITDAYYVTDTNETGYFIGYQNGIFCRWSAASFKGCKWHSGSGVPDASLGVSGDWYLHSLTGMAYEKVSDAWVERTKLKGSYWFFETNAVPAESLGVVGDFCLDVTTHDVYEKGLNGWSLVSNISGIQTRAVKSINAGTIADANTAIGTEAVHKCAMFLKVVVNAPCRVRLYSTDAFRTADLSREATTPVAAGAQTGLILDLVLNNTTGLSWHMSPPAYGANADDTVSDTLYWAVQNLSGGSTNITVELTCIQVER